ncbi:hypothetical protein [Streptomyces sp. NPDC050804]|uniref:effector-associated constant component EACC1 n=1 Tax=Streptomyces sp. NPDC050804 TaxID=3154745 RepID=UPI0034416E6B
MRVRIEVEVMDDPGGEGGEWEGDSEELLSLHRWLDSDPDVAGGSALSLVPRARTGADSEAGTYMGPGPEVIEAVFNGSVQLAQLTLAVATWRLARPRPPRVRIERGGTTVTVEDGDPESIERVLRALDGPGSDPRPGREPDAGTAPEPSARPEPEPEPEPEPGSRSGSGPGGTAGLRTRRSRHGGR